MRTIRILCFASAMMVAACAHVGPKSIPVDHFNYSESIGDSWKEQTLLNIVKLRYMDLPVFLDVSSIVAGYSLQTGVTINGTLRSSEALLGNSAAVNGQAVYTDRPTISYVPLTGEKFLRGMIKPIDPQKIFYLLQSGYPADFILGLTVESLNGVRNRSTAVMQAGDPDFFEALKLLSDVQAANGFGMALQEGDAGNSGSTVLYFRHEGVSVDIAEKATQARRLLMLAPDQQKFTISYSPIRGAEDELAVTSRSMVQIMTAFATYIDAPLEHIQDNSATPAVENVGSQQSIRIHSGKDQPAASFVAVRYRDYWFWIDESDRLSKRALTAVMLLFTLADTGGNEQLPMITIPAQ